MTTAQESLQETQHDDYKRCSFCSKVIDDSLRLIRGPGRVRICDGCVGLCNAEFAARRAQAAGRRSWKRKRPSGAQRRKKATVVVGNDEAVRRVRAQYDRLVRYSTLPLHVINHGRPPAEHFCSQAEYLRELQGRAAATSNLAIETGLITMDQWIQILHDFHDKHPDISFGA